MNVIEARGLAKTYRNKQALGGIDLNIAPGRIVGLIGPNGAGKTTALSAILGLIPHEGHLRVLGRDPWRERGKLMEDVCFVADVAILPRWLRVDQAIDYVEGVHPRFDRAKALHFLSRTDIPKRAKVRKLSKGMVAQLHLALIMAIDAKLLVLDEPTLGLDLLYRRHFYVSLLNDYFDHERTILITTHQIEEVQDVLTDVVFIDQGRIVLDASLEDLSKRYVEIAVRPEHVADAQALSPIHEHLQLGRHIMLFDSVAAEGLRPWGEVRTPNLADLFVVLMARAHSTRRAEVRA